MTYIVGIIVLIALALIFAGRSPKEPKVERKTRTSQKFVDYSGFDQDQMLRNRSEHWE